MGFDRKHSRLAIKTIRLLNYARAVLWLWHLNPRKRYHIFLYRVLVKISFCFCLRVIALRSYRRHLFLFYCCSCCCYLHVASSSCALVVVLRSLCVCLVGGSWSVRLNTAASASTTSTLTKFTGKSTTQNYYCSVASTIELGKQPQHKTWISQTLWQHLRPTKKTFPQFPRLFSFLNAAEALDIRLHYTILYHRERQQGEQAASWIAEATSSATAAARCLKNHVTRLD